MTDIVKAGSVYETTGRRGALTLRLLQDIDLHEDTFFDAEIVDGRAHFVSNAYNAEQRLSGLGTKGTAMSFRTTLTWFVKRRKDLEEASTPNP